MLVKNNGLWVPSQVVKAKVNSEWLDGEAFVKVNGSWKSYVPNNAIILYSSSTYIEDGYLANGSNNTVDLVHNDYPIQIKGSSTYGNTGGSPTHNGSLHGAAVAKSVSSANGYENIALGLKSIQKLTYSTHTDTCPAHSHLGEGSNFGMGSKILMPYQYSSKIYKDAIIPCANTQSVTFLTYVASYINYLIGMGSTSTTKEAESHNHGNTDLANPVITVTQAYGQLVNKWENNIALYYRHTHNVQHTMTDETPIPLNYSTIPYMVNEDIYFNDLPSGSLILFTTPVLPLGWSRYINADDYLLSFNSTSGTITGTATHNHSGNKTSTAYANTGSVYGYDTYGSSSGYYRGLSHDFSWLDEHLTQGEHTPPYISFVIGIKD